MTRSLHIPAAALDQHIAILGKTGSGKTFAAKGIVEDLLDHKRQVCVLDPTAAWWGLRLGADGKSRGYDVVLLGGKHADIPLHEKSGEAVARLVTQQGANVVIDTSGMTVGEYTRWFIAFAGALYTTIERPLHLVMDEAHYFMPQGKSPDVDAGRMLHAGNRLMSGGRSLGIRGLVITQRPAKFHKDSLTCVDTLIAMRVLAPQDRQAVKDWIDGAGDPEMGKKVLESLAGLGKGEGWVWYPEGGFLERVKFPKISTYDSSATPKHGAGSGPAVKEIKLDEVKAAMAEAVKEAEANDPKILKAKIAELQKQINRPVQEAVKLATKTDQETINRTVEQAVAKAIAQRDREWASRFREFHLFSERVKSWLAKAPVAPTNGEAGKPTTFIADFITPPAPARPAKHTEATRPAVQHDRKSENSGDLPRGERAVLNACAQYPDGLRREQLTVLTGYKRSSRDAYIQRLRERGYVDASGDLIVATDAGVTALGDFEPLPTGEALQEYWLRRLPTGERAILEALIQAYPEPVERERLSELTKYQRSSRDAYIQRMRAKQVVEVVGRGAVRASDQLFAGALT
jgi:uncharacterized protein